MQFCDECGSLMHAEGEEMVCSNCGDTVSRPDSLSEDYTSTQRQEDVGLIESEAEANFEGKPSADDVTCEKCGHGEAWYTIKQTGSADEPPTRFFKCKDCGYRWREYN